MPTFIRLSKAGLSLMLLASLALPAFAVSETPFLNQSAAEMIEDTVARIVMQNVQEFYGVKTSPSCIETDSRALCIHPDTPPEQMEEILRSLPTWIDHEHGDRYDRVGRWTVTASGYSGLLGDPIILSYSIVPDGTWIPDEGQGSELIATLDSQFGGNTEVWKQIFRDCFARWAEFSGITYIEETSDDGAGFPNSGGVLGVRGDVRISGANIDGYNGVLAYNWYPQYGGDMVMDTAESWAYTYNDYRFFRNVVMHEHGHGHGLGHIDASNRQLMEPYYDAYIYGPQDDDIRGANRNYGDPNEKNNTAAEATDWGTLGEGTYLQENVSLTSSSDSDYYRFTFTTGMEVDIVLAPVGASYTLDGSPINTSEIMDLGFELRDEVGTTVIEAVNDGSYGDDESLIAYSLEAGTYHVRVRRHAGSDTQRYTISLDAEINDLTAVDDGNVPVSGLGLSVYPTPFNPKTTARFYVQDAGPIKLDVYNVQGRVVRSLSQEAASGWVDISWNGKDDSGMSLPSGLYFLNARTGSQSETVRALLLK